MSNFGSGTPSGPLNFTAGQTVNVVGKYMMGDITLEGSVSPVIANTDFADGYGIIGDSCSGLPNISHNRFRNPGKNAMAWTNSWFGPNSSMVHNVARGRTVDTEDYFLFQNTGGLETANPFRLEYNRSDGRNPDTGAMPVYSVTRGSHIRYGGVTKAGGGNTSIIYCTGICPGPFALDIDSGANIILYYNILVGLALPGSIAAIRLIAAPGTIGNGGVPVQVSVDDIFWLSAAGIDTRYLTDGSLQEVYLSEVNMAIELNAIG